MPIVTVIFLHYARGLGQGRKKLDVGIRRVKTGIIYNNIIVKIYTVILFVQGLENPCYSLLRSTEICRIVNGISYSSALWWPHTNFGNGAISREISRETGLRRITKGASTLAFKRLKKLWQNV